MVRAGGLDDAVIVNREKHCAVESVVLGQDLGQLRQSLLGAVFLVAADEDDLLPLAGTVGPLDYKPGIVSARRRRDGQQPGNPRGQQRQQIGSGK